MGLPIYTERLMLRELTMDDLEPFHLVFGDPDVMTWIPSGVSDDLEHSRKRLQWMIDHQAEHGFSLWAVIEESTGDMIGDCGLLMLEGKGPEVELAYHLARSRWGRGYGAEAAAASLRYGLGELGLDRIIAIADPDHFVSRRVMEKVGMHLDGRAHHYGRDVVRYAISGLGDIA